MIRKDWWGMNQYEMSIAQRQAIYMQFKQQEMHMNGQAGENQFRSIKDGKISAAKLIAADVIDRHPEMQVKRIK